LPFTFSKLIQRDLTAETGEERVTVLVTGDQKLSVGKISVWTFLDISSVDTGAYIAYGALLLKGVRMFDQNRMAGFATLFGAMLLAIAMTMAFFLVRGFVPPFILVVLPAIVGAGLVAAGVLAKRDNGWHGNHAPPERGV